MAFSCTPILPILALDLPMVIGSILLWSWQQTRATIQAKDRQAWMLGFLLVLSLLNLVLFFLSAFVFSKGC